MISNKPYGWNNLPNSVECIIISPNTAKISGLYLVVPIINDTYMLEYIWCLSKTRFCQLDPHSTDLKLANKIIREYIKLF